MVGYVELVGLTLKTDLKCGRPIGHLKNKKPILRLGNLAILSLDTWLVVVGGHCLAGASWNPGTSELLRSPVSDCRISLRNFLNFLKRVFHAVFFEFTLP